jgi:hypothetical protein
MTGKHRFDGRAYRDRQGSPYYGHALWPIIEARDAEINRGMAAIPAEPLSVIDRVTGYYRAHRWPAAMLLAAGVALFGLAVIAATLGWKVR